MTINIYIGVCDGSKLFNCGRAHLLYIFGRKVSLNPGLISVTQNGAFFPRETFQRCSSFLNALPGKHLLKWNVYEIFPKFLWIASILSGSFASSFVLFVTSNDSPLISIFILVWLLPLFLDWIVKLSKYCVSDVATN